MSPKNHDLLNDGQREKRVVIVTDGDDDEDTDSEDDESEDGEESDDEEHPRRSKTMAERAAAQGKRPGPKGRFHGEQRAFLEQLLPKYEAVPKGKRGKNPHLQAFWKETGNAFWATFTVEEVRAQMDVSYKRALGTVIIRETNKVIMDSLSFCVR